MKVFALVLIALSSVSAKGSGPYLPRGWRPSGPAFYLPTKEVTPEPVSEVNLQESEASGSDALREYGPPKYLEADFTKQGLPYEVIARSFVKDNEINAGDGDTETATESVEVTTISAEVPILIIQDATTTEHVGINDVTTDASSVENQETSTHNKIDEENEQTNEELNSYAAVKIQLEGTVQEETQNVQEPTESVENVEEKVSEDQNEKSEIRSDENAQIYEENKDVAQNIPDVLNYASEGSTNVPETQGETTTYPDVFGFLDNAPEGFLEYGPPGFREYGPPKEDELAKESEAIIELDLGGDNAVRRRRFSPKFRPSLKH